MSLIIDKTYLFLDKLDNSNIIRKLKYYKDKSLSNPKVLNLVKKYNNCSDNINQIEYKKELYNISEYKNYMKYYSKLNLIILKINHQYQKYTNTKKT